MPLTNKAHAVTFRLGTREYEQLVRTVATKGSRSLSEFTRTAVLNQIVADGLDKFLKDELNALMDTLDEFDAKVRDLRRQIHQFSMRSDSPSN
jgi:hypothetical protein